MHSSTYALPYWLSGLARMGREKEPDTPMYKMPCVWAVCGMGEDSRFFSHLFPILIADKWHLNITYLQ
jgi:hypothetical protein